MTQFTGRGWPFPLRHPLRYVAGDEKIRQSIWLILNTAPGERLMRPEFGCGIHDLLFEGNTSAFRLTVASSVRDALIQWESRIDVLDVRVETPPDASNYLLIYIDYRVRSNNALYNLVYPYYVNEGVAN